MNLNRRLCAALACVVFVFSGCAADKGSDKAENSGETGSADISDSAVEESADGDAGESKAGQESSSQQSDGQQGGNSQAEIKQADHTLALEAIQSETDKLLTALRDGDVDTLADLLAPDTKWGRFFNSHRDSAGVSNILRVDFGDLVWTYSQTDEQMDIQWLETAAGGYTQTYVTAGVKEMLYFSEYFLLNFGGGSVLTDSYAPDDEAQSQMLLEKTMKKLPLLKNNWSIRCTVPNKDGRVYFNLDDDFIMDYTRLIELKDFSEEEAVTEYIKLMSDDRGKVMDEKAKTGKENDFRVKLLGLLKEYEFEEAWQLLKPDADKEFYGEVPEYDRLTPMQQEAVDEFVRDSVSVVVSDYSTEVYDGTTRRHIFCHIYYDAFAQNDEADIADWLTENNIKQSDGGVYFDITSKDMLPEVLNFYFEAVERAGAAEE